MSNSLGIRTRLGEGIIKCKKRYEIQYEAMQYDGTGLGGSKMEKFIGATKSVCHFITHSHSSVSWILTPGIWIIKDPVGNLFYCSNKEFELYFSMVN